ncbi:hypothetical protein HMI54_003141, partial [Coelomomyces lativittatus]
MVLLLGFFSQFFIVLYLCFTFLYHKSFGQLISNNFFPSLTTSQLKLFENTPIGGNVALINNPLPTGFPIIISSTPVVPSSNPTMFPVIPTFPSPDSSLVFPSSTTSLTSTRSDISTATSTSTSSLSSSTSTSSSLSSKPTTTSSPTPSNPCASGVCNVNNRGTCISMENTGICSAFSNMYLPVKLNAYFAARFPNRDSSQIPIIANGVMFNDLFGDKAYSFMGKYASEYAVLEHGCSTPNQR